MLDDYDHPTPIPQDLLIQHFIEANQGYIVLGTKDSGLSTNNEELTLFVILEYKIFYQHWMRFKKRTILTMPSLGCNWSYCYYSVLSFCRYRDACWSSINWCVQHNCRGSKSLGLLAKGHVRVQWSLVLQSGTQPWRFCVLWEQIQNTHQRYLFSVQN